MIIETQRLRLRPFRLDDAEWYFEVTQEKAVREYLPGTYSKILQDAKNDIKFYYLKGDFIHDFYFIIENKINQQHVGFLNITQDFDGLLEVAMFISPKFRGKRYITEALEGFTKNIPHGKNLRFTVDKQNEASLKAVQKLDGIIELKDEKKENRVFILET